MGDSGLLIGFVDITRIGDIFLGFFLDIFVFWVFLGCKIVDLDVGFADDRVVAGKSREFFPFGFWRLVAMILVSFMDKIPRFSVTSFSGVEDCP